MTVTEDVTEDQALQLIGALEHASEHPIARDRGRSRSADRRPSGGARLRQPRGARRGGQHRRTRVRAGRPGLFADDPATLPEPLRHAIAAAHASGQTAIVGGWDDRARAVFTVADTIKPTSSDAIASLAALGLRPVLLTGDSAAAARVVADQVGITEVIADVLPSEKAGVIQRLQADGAVVAMVGDGVNDAPALAQAGLGLAIGTGTDGAIEASDLTLVSGDLRAAVDAIRLSRRTLATIKGNLFWAFAYNIALVPVAMLASQPALRRRRDGVLQPVRRVQLAAAAPLRPRARRGTPAAGTARSHATVTAATEPLGVR